MQFAITASGMSQLHKWSQILEGLSWIIVEVIVIISMFSQMIQPSEFQVLIGRFYFFLLVCLSGVLFRDTFPTVCPIWMKKKKKKNQHDHKRNLQKSLLRRTFGGPTRVIYRSFSLLNHYWPLILHYISDQVWHFDVNRSYLWEVLWSILMP